MTDRMEPRNSDALRTIFNQLVREAKQEFDEAPFIDLVDNEQPYEEFENEGVKDPQEIIDTKPGFERALLSAFVVVDTKEDEYRGGHLTIMKTKTKNLFVGILENEIFVVKELVRHYEQPDQDFEPNVACWSEREVFFENGWYSGYKPSLADGKGNAALITLAYLRQLAATTAALKELLYNEKLSAEEIVEAIAKHQILI
jgi:hypothetical protein